MTNDDEELALLRDGVDCCVVLEREGWKLDRRESTRSARKYRRGQGEIIIVLHGGRGWFDPLSDARGDVISLAQFLWACNLGHARKHLRPLAGLAPTEQPAFFRRASAVPTSPLTEQAWSEARLPAAGSPGWVYLTQTRGLPADTIITAVRQGALREGRAGTIWGAHRDELAGRVTGWEMRGPHYKGFSAGGHKSVFAVAAVADPESRAVRFAVCEAMIDALSLATLEGWREDTAYLSTAGGWGERTADVVARSLSPSAMLLAATDRGDAGERLAVRLQVLARACGAAFERLKPTTKDWNDDLLKSHREC